MNQDASLIVLELAKEFIEFVRQVEPRWSKAFYRFRFEELRYGANGSLVVDSNAMLIGAIKHAHLYESMNIKGAELLELLDKTQGVFLLTVDSDFNYDVQFEWVDLYRWEITKVNGATGFPTGI